MLARTTSEHISLIRISVQRELSAEEPDLFTAFCTEARRVGPPGHSMVMEPTAREAVSREPLHPDCKAVPSLWLTFLKNLLSCVGAENQA